MNDGINWNSGDNVYWKHDVQRFESLKVILHGNAEFEARDVVLQVSMAVQFLNTFLFWNLTISLLEIIESQLIL